MAQVRIAVVDWNRDRVLWQSLVIPFMIVVGDMFPQDESQVIGRQRDDPSPSLATDGSDEAFDVGIEVWRVRRQNLRHAAYGGEAGAHLRREEGVTIHNDSSHVPQETSVGICFL